MTTNFQPKLAMRFFAKVAPFAFLSFVAACGSDSPTTCCSEGQTGLRVVNAFTSPVDVLIDGSVVVSGLAAGSVGMAAATSGDHTLLLRPTGSTASVSQSITTTTGSLNTIAALRAQSGSLSTTVLDDTNSVVPAGATKVRVLHFAPSAGTLQVFRTQPDYQTPIAWQFPFTYQATPNSLSAPFYQSTAGTWEVRIWQTPADASGWANAPVKVVIPLLSGEKRTILILDDVGGGVRTQVL
ncbi:MAG: DUF4397 domain-containing protein [bacterium]